MSVHYSNDGQPWSRATAPARVRWWERIDWPTLLVGLGLQTGIDTVLLLLGG